MKPFSIWCVAILLLKVTVSEAFQWTGELQNAKVLAACAGGNVVLSWNFTLAPGETVQDIKWNYQRKGNDKQQMVAVSAGGTFLPTQQFSGRVRHLATAGIVVREVSVSDSGNYSVQMDVKGVIGMVTGYSRSVYVDVADAFRLTQEPEAVYDVTTESWHVVLKCGAVDRNGQSNVDVLWRTPSRDLASTTYENGYFYLNVPNPLEGGNYTCILPGNLGATACVPSTTGRSPQSSIFVDKMEARLTVLQAENTAVKKKTSELLTDNISLRKEMKRFHDKTAQRVSFHARLSSSRQMPDDSPVILDHVYTNEGGAYSPTTGVFTVPVNGTYILFTAVGTDTASRFSEAYLMVDNIWVCDTYSKDKGDYQSSSCQAVVHLVKGQKVWMRANGNSYFYTSLTSFSGVLVLPDM